MPPSYEFFPPTLKISLEFMERFFSTKTLVLCSSAYLIFSKYLGNGQTHVDEI